MAIPSGKQRASQLRKAPNYTRNEEPPINMTISIPGETKTERSVEDLARLFKILSEPNRLKILYNLGFECTPVSTIISDTGLSQTNVSFHLPCNKTLTYFLSCNLRRFTIIAMMAGITVTIPNRRTGSIIWFRSVITISLPK